MKKLLFLFLLSTGVGFAQCAVRKSSAFELIGIGVSSISAPTDNIVWISANSGHNNTAAVPYTNRQIAVSTDAGNTFTRRAVNLYASATQNNDMAISNVQGLNATVGYIAAHGSATAAGGVWKTTDAGATWTRQNTAAYNTPSANGEGSFTNFVYFWDENNGVTMGDPAGGYFEIYTTTNGGINWVRTPSSAMPAPLAPVPMPTPPYVEYGLTNQFVVTGNTIWVGTTFGRILKSTDKGLTWTAINTPIPGFSGGEFTPAPTGYNANQDWKNDLQGTITDSDSKYYRTSDGGVTWVEDTNGIPNTFDFTYVPGTTATVVCVGDDSDAISREINVSFDDGQNWIKCPDTNGGFGGILEIRSMAVGYLGGFTTSTAVGGFWKLNDLTPLLANNVFTEVNVATLSPNPTTGIVNLKGTNINQVTVTDILGKVVSNNNYSSLTDVTLNLSDLNSGIYFVKVSNNEGKTSVSKVVKQ